MTLMLCTKRMSYMFQSFLSHHIFQTFFCFYCYINVTLQLLTYCSCYLMEWWRHSNIILFLLCLLWPMHVFLSLVGRPMDQSICYNMWIFISRCLLHSLKTWSNKETFTGISLLPLTRAFHLFLFQNKSCLGWSIILF